MQLYMIGDLLTPQRSAWDEKKVPTFDLQLVYMMDVRPPTKSLLDVLLQIHPNCVESTFITFNF